MISQSENSTIIDNGEIYNALSICSELKNSVFFHAILRILKFFWKFVSTGAVKLLSRE